MEALELKSNENLSQVFRLECREWLIENCPAEMRDGKTGSEGRCWGGKKWEFESEFQKQWLRKCIEKGWTVPTWPKEFGGAGMSALNADILKEEMVSLGIRAPLYSYGITMLGPAILKYGTEQQKSKHLPPIARGEIRWCQGYSEPNAGSDLASLKTKCVDTGNDWVINGQKVWTSGADESDWIFAMVRTSNEGRKHDGISFILMDLADEAITVRPIELISGKSVFCEVFFDEVKVPKYYGPDNPSMLGSLGQGWEVGMYLLTHERGSLGGYTLNGRGHELPIIETTINQIGLNENNKLNDPVARVNLSTALIDDAASTALAELLDSQSNSGIEIGSQSSIVKYASTQIIKRGYELRIAVSDLEDLKLGEDGQPGTMASNWLYSRAYTILGGTSEIQLNIIAKRLLNLPSK